MQKILLEINAIKCQGCVDKIQKALKKAKGVQTCAIDLTTKIAAIEYDSTKVDAEGIKEVITKVGYLPVVKA